MKIKKIIRLEKKYDECDITTKNENFYVKCGNTYILIHNSPAVFSGINPENGKFFVATKGLFNKNPKMCYTIKDCKNNYQGDLQAKMITALTYLPKLGIKGIYQGDLLYTQSDLKTKTIDGEKFITFHPNTIVYAVPYDSALAKQIMKSKMGIVFHTQYTGKTIDNLNANFNINIKSFRQTSDVWFEDAFFKDQSGLASLSPKEQKDFFVAMSEIKMYAKKFNPRFLDQLSAYTDVFNMLKTYTNQRVRAGEEINAVPAFIKFIYDRKQKDIDAVKSEKAKESHIAKRDILVQFLRDNAHDIKVIFFLHHAITKAKMILVNKLSSVSTLSTFVKDNNGFKVVAPEGFVAISRMNGQAIKLVDRLTFSKNNFDSSLKAWNV